jgi:hypothetical protein
MQLIFEFPLDTAPIITSSHQVLVVLGNGVTLKTPLPKWVEGVRKGTLQLTLEVDGSPNANTIKSPVK